MSDQLFNIASKFEPKIKNGLLRAFNEIKAQVDLVEVENVLVTQGITGVVRLLNDLPIENIVQSEIIDDINQAIIESGRMSLSVIPPEAITGSIFYYNILNPITSNYIRDYEFGLIQIISSNTRQAIRNSIEAGIISGQNPKLTAKSFTDTLGLTPKQEIAVRNYKTYLENLDSQALQRQLRDKRFDGTIRNAISNNQKLSEAQIDKMVNAYQKRYVNFRAETIARTESLRAISIGEYTGVVQAAQSGAIDSSLIKRFWIHAGDGNVRNEHRSIPGLNPNGVDIEQPFSTPLGPLLFPRDPRGTASNTINCRCHVIYKII